MLYLNVDEYIKCKKCLNYCLREYIGFNTQLSKVYKDEAGLKWIGRTCGVCSRPNPRVRSFHDREYCKWYAPTTCKHCNKVFSPKRENQQYCKWWHSPKGRLTKKHQRREARKLRPRGAKTKHPISKYYKKQIVEFYKNRPEGMEIDHIVPLNGPNVSGLHVPWNFQYLTPEENRTKSNRLY